MNVSNMKRYRRKKRKNDKPEHKTIEELNEYYDKQSKLIENKEQNDEKQKEEDIKRIKDKAQKQQIYAICIHKFMNGNYEEYEGSFFRYRVDAITYRDLIGDDYYIKECNFYEDL